MGIENLNRVHWALLGIFLGVALAYAWVGTTDNVEGMAETSQTIFEGEITQKEGDLPLISGVVVHPTQYSPADGCDVNQVTYKRLARDKTGKMDYWLNRWFVAKIPYRPLRLRPQTSGDPAKYTIDEYLSDVAKMPNLGFVKSRYGWWMIPKNAMMVGGLGGMAVLGGVWPTLLGIMTGAGLGPKKKEKKESLWNYKSKTEAKAQIQKPAITAQDRAHLESLTSSYEKELAASGVSMTGAASADGPTGAVATRTSQELRKLEQGTLKDATQSESDDDSELKYKEYYPVVIHHKKPLDEPKKPGPDDTKHT